MKFSIQRDEIYEVLQKVVSVIPQRSTISTTQNVLLTARGNQLELMTTDLEITMVSHVNAQIEEEGAIAVPGKLVHDIIRELPNVSLTLSAGGNYRAELRSDFGHYKIGGENPAEFPKRPLLETVREIQLPNDTLKRLLDKSSFASSTDELRPALTGLFFEIGAGKMRTVATDGHRLAMMTYRSDDLPEDDIRAILSTRAINFVMRNLEPEGITALAFGDKHARVHMDNTILFARLIDEQYVDYNRVIPPETQFEMAIDTASFLSSVKRVSLFSNPITAQVVFRIGAEQVEVQAEDLDYGGEASESIPCTYTGEEMTIGFNSRYLQDLLRHIDAPQVVFRLIRPDFAVLAEPGDGPENEEQLMLLMPIRLESA